MPLKPEMLKVSATSAQGIQFAVAGTGIQDLAVEILDLSGRRVFTSGFVQGGILRWNLQNSVGDRVARGIYLYVARVRGANGEILQSGVQKLVVRN